MKLKDTIFSDEKKFTVQATPNKQNIRFWGENKESVDRTFAMYKEKSNVH